MRRSDDLLLARMLLRRTPGAREMVRAALSQAESDDGSGKSPVAQFLIRKKLLSPSDYVALQQEIESAKRRCPGCKRGFIAFATARERKVRCLRCGTRLPLPARPAAGAVSAKDETREVAPVGPAPAKSGRPQGSTKPAPAGSAKPAPAGSAKPAPGAPAKAQAKKTNPARPKDTRRDSDSTTSQQFPARIGNYAIEGVVAQGGMGIVYRAFDPRAKRRVALKVLRGDATEDMAARFKREAEAIARLTHPGIVGIHEAGVDRGMRYFTMDLVEGEDLEKAIASKRLTREELARIGAELGDALHHAHEKGIIHRDVKPQNVLVPAGTSTARLTDFGLARDLARSGLTEDGDLIGTPYYMAPEQFTTGECDRRTDVYALGTLLYRALAGELPFEATTLFDLKTKVLERAPVAPSERVPEIPRDLDRIVLKALEKHPDDRYQTAAELSKDLRAWLAGRAVEAKATAAPKKVVRALGRRSVQVGLVVGIAVLSIGVSTWIVIDARNKKIEKEQRREQERRDALARFTQANDRATECVKTGFDSLARGDAKNGIERFDEALVEVGKARAAIAALPEKERRDAEPGLRGSELAARRGRLEALASGAADERARARKEAEEILGEDPKDADALVAIGRLELDGGRLRAALDALGRAVDADAGRLDALYYRGEAYRRSGQAAFAILDLQKALAGPPTGLRRVPRESVLAARARARLADGNREGAGRDVDEALKLAPRSADAHAARADLLRAQDEPDGALAELELACSIQGTRGDLRRERGALRALLGDRERALEDLDAALGLDPRDRVAATLRARLRSLALDDEGADKDLDRALAPGADDDPASPAGRMARLVLARVRRAQGRPDQALAALDLACPAEQKATTSQELPLRLERVEILLERPTETNVAAAAREAELLLAAHPASTRALRAAARVSLVRREGVPAKERLDRALEIDPRDGIARALRIQALRLLHDDGEAKKECERATRAQRAFLAAAPALVDVGLPEEEALELLETGRRVLARTRTPEPRDVERALKAFARAATLAPELTPVHVAAAEAHRLREALGDALRALDVAAKLGPPFVEQLALRARILVARGDRDPAIEAYGEALAAAKAEPGFIALRAQLHLERGRARLDKRDAQGALPDLDEACNLDRVSMDAFAARARAHEMLGNAEAAAKDRERVALLDKGYVAVLKKLEEETFTNRAMNEHAYAAQLYTKAFDCVPRTDASQRATLYLVRAFMRIRALEVPEGLLDLAGMIELDPTRLAEFWDELVRVPDTVDIDTLLQTAQERVSDREPDPDFFAGVAALVKLEFTRGQHVNRDERQRIARQGIAALGRYLERAPLHPTALVFRSFLRTNAGDLSGAAHDARAVLDVMPTYGAGEFALARVYLARRDRDAALARIEAAFKHRFFAWQAIDRAMEGQDDPRLVRAIGLARGSESLHFLTKVDDQLPQREGKNRASAIIEGIDACGAGLKALAPLVKAGDVDAQRIAFRLRLARARYLRLQDEPDPAGQLRDLAAAIEVAPEAIGAGWAELVAAARQVGRADDKRITLVPGEVEPTTPFARAASDLVSALQRPERARHLAAFDGVTTPSGLAARAILKLSGGDADGALADAKDERLRKVAPATADFLAARAEALRKRTDDALRLLRAAVSAGVRGADVRDDWALDSIRDTAAFRELTAPR